MILHAAKKLLKKSRTVWKIFWLIHHAKMKWRCRRVLLYDRRLLNRHAGFAGKGEKYALAYSLHKIEKGLALSDFKPGFGGKNVSSLITAVRAYVANGGSARDFECACALNALAAYGKRHEETEAALDPALREALDALLDEYPPTSEEAAVTMAREEYFRYARADFAAFSASRRSVRELAGKAPEEDIMAAAALAANAPSACNRQPCHVHYYADEAQIKAILALQNGNRGFGSRARQLLIVTADLPAVLWPEERRDIAFNAGLFAMNLSYALHYRKIAHCLLNCSFDTEKEAEVRHIAGIPAQEAVMLMVICGQAPAVIRLTASRRKTPKEFFTAHAGARGLEGA